VKQGLFEVPRRALARRPQSVIQGMSVVTGTMAVVSSPGLRPPLKGISFGARRIRATAMGIYRGGKPVTDKYRKKLGREWFELLAD